MLNRDIYLKDPSKVKLANEGVANVNDDATTQALAVLRYELETFVCDGQYAKGLEHILDTYLKNIDQLQQPAVWVSGFYGSGKSHFVKMLRALWVDSVFEDGATARGIAALPEGVRDLLRELSTQGKRYGGLRAASGTLGAGASGSVRLALLRIVFKSVGLPEQEPQARFVIWLRKENIYEKVRQIVEENGGNWQEEIDSFYVAELLHEALVHAKPGLFSSPATCADILINLYPYRSDISSDEMVKLILQALTTDGKFPLTLIVLDEIQQFIGEDSLRSSDVQEMVEACCKQIGGKLLFVGTGQTAVTGTANLKKLEGRFTIRIELSDADVDAVIRKVILAKKPEAVNAVKEVLQTNLGEISRHLAGTTLCHRQDDVEYFAQDYPLLPSRRRFWESTLRVLDQTGTDSQLRNQLSMVHKVLQTNLNEELGNVVPADYLYFESADKMLQGRILPRKVYEKTMQWIRGSEDEQIMARACGLVFLINKLSGSNNEIGIQSTPDTIADLMIENISIGSSTLRSRLPDLLDKCQLVMKVVSEYRIQTEESTAWNDEFLNQRSELLNQAHRVEAERDDRIRKKFGELVKKLSLTHGSSKVNREVSPVFDTQLPTDNQKRIYVWVRTGWYVDENSVRVDARQASNQSPTIFVFIPKRSADDLRRNVIDFKAASSTLEKRGVPNTAEGIEARSAMETTKQTSEGKIKEFLAEAFAGSHVYQGGGNEVLGTNLQDAVLQAAESALARLYPQFHIADQPDWEKVYANAKKGAPDALKAIGYAGETADNPVCKAVLGFVAGGKKGSEIRDHFEAPPYGWPRDATDGGLQVLLVTGLVRGLGERGESVNPKDLERKQIGKALFKIESATVTATQRIQVRMLLERLKCQHKQGEELAAIPAFIEKMLSLADRAGGEPPKPKKPDTSSLEDIRLSSGNDQILALYNKREELTKATEEWTALANSIETRWQSWLHLQDLLTHAGDINAAKEAEQQAQAIQNQRLLLFDPDPIEPILHLLQDTLRETLISLRNSYAERMEKLKTELESDSSWSKLSPDERDSLWEQSEISPPPELPVGTLEDLIKTLDDHPIHVWYDRIDALPARFGRLRESAAKLLEPETQVVELPHDTLRTTEDVEAWVEKVKQKLMEQIRKGPIIV
ncbi:MAG: BREX system P-loop protein BrxC [Deltaproteobacteria bacterium]|nr:BREX system P-loop protein BrxC [Deltaproteobacteria bacterium]